MGKWADIPGWEGLYQANESGLIRSLPRHVPRIGRGRQTWAGQELVQSLNARTGYRQVGLAGNGRRKSMPVHVLVAAAFHGTRPDKLDVAHLDGDRLNNTAANLTYASRAENLSHRIAHGTANRGQRHGAAKLSDDVVRQIPRRVRSGERQCDIAAELGVDRSTISHLMRGREWAHVTGLGQPTGGCHR